MQPKPILLGLNSNVGKSGKDTLCSMLNAERFAFADSLKRETGETITVSSESAQAFYEACHDQDAKDTDMSVLAIQWRKPSAFIEMLKLDHDVKKARSPRWWIQQYGMYRRNQNADYWLNRTLGDIEGFMATTESFTKEFIIVTDVRMPNEADWVKSHGGILIRVERDWEEPELDFKQKHISDVALDDYPIPVIENHWGHKDDMVSQLKEILHANRIEI